MSFSDEHSARCLRYGQAQRGRRSDAPGWQPAPAPKRAEGTLPPGALPLRATDDKPSGADARARCAEGLPGKREHEEQEPPAQHTAGVMPRARGPTQPVRPSDAQPPGNALRAVVDSRQRVQIESPNCEISPLLVSDKTCRYLLTVLGIGPRTASELEIPIDIGGFPSHDKQASHCGLAPHNRQSGTSISSVSVSHQSSKCLKDLLIFPCYSPMRNRNR